MSSRKRESRTTESTPISAAWRLHAFDVLAAAGGLINLIVIVLLVGYWLLR